MSAASTTLRAHQLTVDGRTAFVQDWGPEHGRPLLAIHTAGQSGVQYRDAARELAALGYRVLVPDLPGHGHSEPARGGPVTDLADYARFCLKALTLLRIDRPVVVGCSIGGKIALEIGALAGDGIAAIIAMAANAEAGHVNIRAMRRELTDISAPSRSDRTYWGTLAVMGSAVSTRRRELIGRMHCREDPQVSGSDLLAWGTHDVAERLPRITAPTHLVVGDDDLWVDAERVGRAAGRIGRSRFTRLPGIGHYPMEEMDDFADVIDGWVEDLLALGAHTAAGASAPATPPEGENP
ncbi:alpha/beta hydrolase [Brevibacterium salitolerans]|uniref:Alpha/beta hydrolase n=1 Tax=Brevibacterium salitolerans TaxID=1403566 RepID=A0ABN2WMR6_9MICO